MIIFRDKILLLFRIAAGGDQHICGFYFGAKVAKELRCHLGARRIHSKKDQLDKGERFDDLLLPRLSSSSREELYIAASLTTKGVVSIRASVHSSCEDCFQLCRREFVDLTRGSEQIHSSLATDLIFIVDNILETFLAELSLNNLLLDGTGPHEPIDITSLELTLSPDAPCSLLITCRIPIWIEENQSICSDKIDSATTGFAREEKSKAAILQIIEFRD